MQVIRDALASADLPYAAIATIGNYDGIHRGQRAVIDRVIARARELGTQAVVISFDPHPLRVLRPQEAPPLLTSRRQREALLEEAGIDVLVEVRFTRELALTPAERFARDLLHRAMAVQEIYVGRGFHFGHNREGDLALLERLGAELGFAAYGVDEVLHQGAPISSTRIRQAVAAGDVALAMELLGRPYALRGVIQRGDRMGMRLGWPTINLESENELTPAEGVYVGQASFPSFPATFDCVTNIGTRPTVYEHYQRVVESHILGFDADVYGETVEISFFKRLREERLFPNVMELSAQIGRDVEAAREYFAARRRLQERSQEIAES
ncbi:MAG: riboflavin biosynthesis protein RibF [Acidobacteria bacterium]|nr:MAG: riboflavin biosynthesis protein RibF [Acidobacteriota bacterium]